jgi:hypothetical protein
MVMVFLLTKRSDDLKARKFYIFNLTDDTVVGVNDFAQASTFADLEGYAVVETETGRIINEEGEAYDADGDLLSQVLALALNKALRKP